MLAGMRLFPLYTQLIAQLILPMMVLLSMGASAATPSSAASMQAARSDIMELEHALQELKQRHNIPCLTVALTTAPPTGSQLIALGCDAHNLLRWGSITKTFTALTLLSLHEDGLIDLYVPIATYLDPSLWDNPWRSSRPIRAIDLIELRAGLPDLSARAFNYNQAMDLSTALAFERTQLRALWPPGLQHGYSNLAPGLSQLLIEQVTNNSYADEVARRLFAPLQMASAGFRQTGTMTPGYKADGKTPLPYWQMTFTAFGALNASTADMQRFLGALTGQTELTPVQYAHLRKPHGRRRDPDFNFDYAAGFYPRIRQGFVWHNHGGDADGYRSRISILADTPRGYVANITSDNPRALRQVERAVEKYLTADLTQPAVASAANLSTATLATYTGKYYPATVRFGISAWQAGQLPSATVTLRDDQLWFSNGEKNTQLIAVNARHFRRATDPVATIAFVADGEQLYLHGELGNFVRLTPCPTYLGFLSQCNP